MDKKQYLTKQEIYELIWRSCYNTAHHITEKLKQKGNLTQKDQDEILKLTQENIKKLFWN